jgi:hypothetical protein
MRLLDLIGIFAALVASLVFFMVFIVIIGLLGNALGDDKFADIDLVLHQIGDDSLDVGRDTLDVVVAEQKGEDVLEDLPDEVAVVSSDAFETFLVNFVVVFV